MSKPSEILTALKAQLQNNSNLSYVNDAAILLGIRKELTIFPSIVIERISNSEANYVYPKKRLTMKVAIVCFIDVKDKDKQIVGDANVKGTMDIENDVKLALDSDLTLGGKAFKLEIIDSLDDFIDYPIRSVEIIVDIKYEQTKGTRA